MRSSRSSRRSTSRGRSRPSLTFALVLALLLLVQACVTTASAASAGTWETIDAPPLVGQSVTALLPDGEGGMWVGTEERGLARWNGRQWRQYGTAEGLPDNRVVALYLDREHRLWVSTGTGLGYLPSDGGKFRRVSVRGLPALPVLALGQQEDGGILLGLPAGLAVWQPDGALKVVPELAGKRVLALQSGRDGVTWVGTSAGLWRGVHGGWVREESTGSSPISAVAEGPDGVVFALGQEAAWQLKSGSWQQWAALKPGGVRTAVLRDGTLWLGGLQGIAAGQGDVWQTYSPASLPAPVVTALAWDGAGTLWIGTPSGLAQYRPDPRAPAIAIRSVNGVDAGAGGVEIQTDRLEQIALVAADEGTAPQSLRLFLRLDGVDQAPRLLTPAEQRDLGAITVYAGTRLGAGAHVLRAWAQDEAFNRSPEARVTVNVPDFARGPGGLIVRRNTAYAGFAGLALVVVAGVTTTGAINTQRRRRTRAAEAAAAQVRAAAGRSAELYTAALPLREREMQTAVAALQDRSVLLIGEGGAGKTTGLGQLASALSARQSTRIFAPAMLDLAVADETQVFRALISAIGDALHPLATGEWPRLALGEGAGLPYAEREFSSDLGLFLAWLQPQLNKPLVLVLLLDNAGWLDSCGAACRDAFRRLILASSSPASPVRFVLAGERAPAMLGDFADLFQIVLLSPLGNDAAANLLRRGTLGLLDWDPDAERLALDRAGGNPAALSLVGRQAARAALADNRLRILAADVP